MLKRGDNISWGSINVPVIAITMNANNFLFRAYFPRGKELASNFMKNTHVQTFSLQLKVFF